jgi:hypothetical protein
MVHQKPSLLGQPIAVPARREGDCRVCRRHGRPSRLVTDGTEVADVVEETRFNGKFRQRTGRAAIWLNCPVDGNPVQFALGVLL